MIENIKRNLKELGFTKNEIKVYIAITKLGEAVASQVAKKANLPRTTTISILNKLKDENYLTHNKHRGTTYYWVESPKTIVNSFVHKVDIAQQLNVLLTDLYRTESHFPFAQVYDTKTGIKKFIEKTLINLEKGSTIFTIDMPGAGNYTKIYSEDVEKIFTQQKNKRNVLTHTLVPFGNFEKIDEEKLKRQNIKIKEMPEGVNFNSSLWLVGDVLVHFSGTPPFLVVVRHGLIVAGIKSIYDFLWNISQSKN